MTDLYHFSADGRQVLITDPCPPRAWSNYLWNEEGYQCDVSQQGSGESHYLSPQMVMLNMAEQKGRYFYVRDDATNVAWNPGFAPMQTPLDAYVCEHAIGYTEIRSAKDGIETSIRYMVPRHGLQEVWKVTVRNTSDKVRNLSLFAVNDMDFDGQFEQPRYYYNCTFTTMGFDAELNGIYAWTNNPYNPHDNYNGFFCASEPVAAWDTSTTRFVGGDSDFGHPAMVLKGLDGTNQGNVTDKRTGVLQNKLVLQPGETKEIMYSLTTVR